jgi:hypothetical protein
MPVLVRVHTPVRRDLTVRQTHIHTHTQRRKHLLPYDWPQLDSILWSAGGNSPLTPASLDTTPHTTTQRDHKNRAHTQRKRGEKPESIDSACAQERDQGSRA